MLHTDEITFTMCSSLNILPHNLASGIYTINVDFTSEFFIPFSHKTLF